MKHVSIEAYLKALERFRDYKINPPKTVHIIKQFSGVDSGWTACGRFRVVREFEHERWPKHLTNWYWNMTCLTCAHSKYVADQRRNRAKQGTNPNI